MNSLLQIFEVFFPRVERVAAKPQLTLVRRFLVHAAELVVRVQQSNADAHLLRSQTDLAVVTVVAAMPTSFAHRLVSQNRRQVVVEVVELTHGGDADVAHLLEAAAAVAAEPLSVDQVVDQGVHPLAPRPE